MSTRDGYGSSELVEPALNHAGLIIRRKDPNNLETPFNQLGEFITPSELFYIRSHFPIAELDPAAFRLSIRGAVAERTELELRRYPRHAFMEVRRDTEMRRQRPGIPSAARAQRAVGTRRGWQCGTDWCSPSCAFESARLADRVCDIILEGADRGVPKKSQSRRVRSLCPQHPEGAGDGT